MSSSFRAGNALATPQAEPGTAHHPLPIAPMWREIAAYSTFAISYIVYLTFLIAWMRDQALPTSWVVGTWSALGIGSILGPLPWRRGLSPRATPWTRAMAAPPFSELVSRWHGHSSDAVTAPSVRSRSVG